MKTKDWDKTLRLKKYIFSFLLCILLCMFFSMGNAGYSQAKVKAMNLSSKCSVKAKGKNDCQVKLSWDKKKVDKYRIYYRTYTDGAWSKYKKIAAISGKRTSYCKGVKYNKNYGFMVVGYVKKAGGYRKKCSDTVSAYPTGFLYWNWEEGSSLYATSPEFIKFDFYHDRKYSNLGRTIRKSIMPSYIEIERRVAGTSKFRRIKKISKKKLKKHTHFVYKDTAVTKGTVYEYRLRAVKKYKKNNKTKRMILCQESMTSMAVYDEPEVEVSLLAQQETALSYAILAIKNKPGNGEITFCNKKGYELTGCYFLVEMKHIIDMKVTEASYDQLNWTDLTNKENQITIREGETVYLKLQQSKGLTFSLPADDSIYLKFIEIHYSTGGCLILNCDLSAGKGTTTSYY